MDRLPQMLTTRQASNETGLSVNKLRALIESGKLPAVNSAASDRQARWLINREHLEAFLTPTNIAPRKKPKPARRQRIDRNVPQVF